MCQIAIKMGPVLVNGSLQGAALFKDFSDLSLPWEYLDEIYRKGLIAG
jgi:hypothetical protein